eukprot:12412234-Heterocapsa_arctica.AAC.1
MEWLLISMHRNKKLLQFQLFGGLPARLPNASPLKGQSCRARRVISPTPDYRVRSCIAVAT